VLREQYKTYEKLLLAGVDPFIVSNKGKTALDMIMKNNNLKWNFMDKISKEVLKLIQLDIVRNMEDKTLDDAQDFW
jgi:ankyrin repeat protein